MSARYNLRSRVRQNEHIEMDMDSKIEEVANILYNLRSRNNQVNYSGGAPKNSVYMMDTNVSEMKAEENNKGEWVDEYTDEEIVRQACSCISRRNDPPERFFELLRMYDGGELSADFVDWMYGIPPIRRYMENKSMRKSNSTRHSERIQRQIVKNQTSPLVRSKNAVGFSTNLIRYPVRSVNNRGSQYNLRPRRGGSVTGTAEGEPRFP
jgi:hypothetical protein